MGGLRRAGVYWSRAARTRRDAGVPRRGARMALPIDTTRTGMLRQQQVLDTVAHNVANVDTPGFKATYAALESGELPPPADPNAPADDSGAPLTGRIEINRR